MTKIHFIVTLYDEPAEQLRWFAQHLRNAYHTDPVSVVTDGKSRDCWRTVCREFGLKYLPFPLRLKELDHGARWWERFFACAFREEFENVVKLDPDTLIRRAFVSIPDFDVAGTLQKDGVIQGGCQVFSLNAATKLRTSKLYLDPAYRDPAIWALSPRNMAYARSKGEVSTDYTLAHMIRRLQLNVGDWSEIDSQYSSNPKFRRYGVSVSHPHKIQTAILK